MSTKRKDEREKQIEELLEVETGEAKAGIFGREFCELCGQPGSFSGFAGAMAAHPDGRRFICSRCRKGQSASVQNKPAGVTLDEWILERGYRYCGGCGREVLLREQTLEEARRVPFHCPACQGLGRGETARRRYLEHEARKKGGLQRAAGRIYWAKAEIESILAEVDEGSEED